MSRSEEVRGVTDLSLWPELDSAVTAHKQNHGRLGNAGTIRRPPSEYSPIFLGRGRPQISDLKFIQISVGSVGPSFEGLTCPL
jgi:hypothetical protein